MDTTLCFIEFRGSLQTDINQLSTRSFLNTAVRFDMAAIWILRQNCLESVVPIRVPRQEEAEHGEIIIKGWCVKYCGFSGKADKYCGLLEEVRRKDGGKS